MVHQEMYQTRWGRGTGFLAEHLDEVSENRQNVQLKLIRDSRNSHIMPSHHTTTPYEYVRHVESCDIMPTVHICTGVLLNEKPRNMLEGVQKILPLEHVHVRHDQLIQ